MYSFELVSEVPGVNAERPIYHRAWWW